MVTKKSESCTCVECKCDPCECKNGACSTSKTCSSTWCNWGAALRIAIVVAMIVGAFMAGSYYTNCMNQKGCSHYSDDKKRSYDSNKLLINEGPYGRNHTMSMSHDMMSMSMADMSTMMVGKTGDALDRAFLEGMIPHHQGAVDMAKMMAGSKHPELVKFASDIIAGQSREIEQMKKWMQEWGYTSTGVTQTGSSNMHMMPDGTMMMDM